MGGIIAHQARERRYLDQDDAGLPRRAGQGSLPTLLAAT
jgi:hypothetical protein